MLDVLQYALAFALFAFFLIPAVCGVGLILVYLLAFVVTVVLAAVAPVTIAVLKIKGMFRKSQKPKTKELDQ